VGAWCTLRQAFRNFRVDRIREAAQGEDRFGKRRAILLKEWERVWAAEAEERRGLAPSPS